MRCIIVDDEPLALDILETYIAAHPQLELVARCQNALEAFKALQQHEPDLLFLDIQMPQMTGIELLESLKNPPLVIFTTAYPNYALTGFELNVTDYLLKPISRERFAAAVHKAATLHESKAAPTAFAQATTAVDDFIFVKADKKLVKIRFDDILFIEGLKDYVIIRTTQGRVITLQTMKSLEEKLPVDRFFRVHRSYIISLDKIESIDGNVVEIAKQQLPIGKNYKDEILELVSKNRI